MNSCDSVNNVEEKEFVDNSVHNVYDDEDEYSYSDDDYAEFCEDEQFDGFLTDNAPPPMDLVQEEIANFLRIGMDRKNASEVACNLVHLCKENGSQVVFSPNFNSTLCLTETTREVHL